MRIPDHPVALALLAGMGEPMVSSSLLLPGEEAPLTDGWLVKEALDHQVDAVIDSDECGNEPTTVVDFSDGSARYCGSAWVTRRRSADLRPRGCSRAPTGTWWLRHWSVGHHGSMSEAGSTPSKSPADPHADPPADPPADPAADLPEGAESPADATRRRFREALERKKSGHHGDSGSPDPRPRAPHSAPAKPQRTFRRKSG